jgi:hypothetical protein
VFDLAAEHGLNFPGGSWDEAKAALDEAWAEVADDLMALDEEIVNRLTDGKPSHKGPIVVESKPADALPDAMDRLCGGAVVMTPAPLMAGDNEGYWLFRVPLREGQAIVAFPKFGTIGIGFAQEDDWNTNLPFDNPALRLYEHIKHNKKYKLITRADALKAILAAQRATFNYLKKHYVEVAV